jgi:hypothetical protein
MLVPPSCRAVSRMREKVEVSRTADLTNLDLVGRVACPARTAPPPQLSPAAPSATGRIRGRRKRGFDGGAGGADHRPYPRAVPSRPLPVNPGIQQRVSSIVHLISRHIRGYVKEQPANPLWPTTKSLSTIKVVYVL